MKIYPQEHEIVPCSTNIKVDTDIPLCYIDTVSKNHNYNVKNYLYNYEMTPIMPYESFATNNVLFFDKVKNQNYGVNFLVREGINYVYYPSTSTVYIPETFMYTITIKKNIVYSSSKIYDFKVACIKNDKDISSQMIKIFADASVRNLCPKNISVNQNDISIDSLKPIGNEDFIFVHSTDGKDFDYNRYLDECTNVIMFVDNYEKMSEISDEKEFVFSNPIINNCTIKTKYVFDNSDSDCLSLFNQQNKTNLPIYLREYSGKGFLAICHSSICNNIENYYSFIYELLMQIYVRTYLKSKSLVSWIFGIIPDFVESKGKLYKFTSFTSDKPIQDIFSLDQNEIILYKVDINEEGIDYVLQSNGYLCFEYIQNPSILNNDGIMIYTHRKDIIKIDKILYKYEQEPEISIVINEDTKSATINVSDFYSTSNNIAYNSNESFIVSFEKTINYEKVEPEEMCIRIYFKNGVLYAKEVSLCSENDGSIKIADITFFKENSGTIIYDMRQRGGGCDTESEYDQDLFDKSSILGKAYRPGGAAVITLPLKCKEYDGIIKNELEKHKIADHAIIILYE